MEENDKSSYTPPYFYSKHSQDLVTSTNKINPSLSEVVVSTIAHNLFPNHFPRYQFLNSSLCLNVLAGYKLQVQKTECDNAVGVEEIYATSLFLGIKIKSHFCIKEDDVTYIFIDDFSRSLHMIDQEEGGLIYEYRGSKDPSTKQMLFPNKFLNNNCGEWLGLGCNLTKLSSAYRHILDAVPDMEVQSIITSAVSATQDIVHNHNSKNDCVNVQEVDPFFEYLSNDCLDKISTNYLALLGLFENSDI